MVEFWIILEEVINKSFVLVDEFCWGIDVGKGFFIVVSVIEILDCIGCIGVFLMYLYDFLDMEFWMR